MGGCLKVNNTDLPKRASTRFSKRRPEASAFRSTRRTTNIVNQKALSWPYGIDGFHFMSLQESEWQVAQR